MSSATNDINDNSNIVGLGFILNSNKIQKGVDIEEVEKRLRNLDSYNNQFQTNFDEDPIKDYENTIKEINQADDTMSVVDSEMSEIDDLLRNSGESVAASEYSYESEHMDEFEKKKTREEVNRTHVNQVLDDVPDMDFDLDYEAQEELKANLLEQIDGLRDDLQELGIKIHRIPEVSSDSTIQQIEEVHRILMHKYNKFKFSSFADEVLLAGANILENVIFNGKRDYFGKKIDVAGYTDVVKSKLKRVRFETSTIVSNTVKHYNISPGTRILLELIPCLITQAHKRKIQFNDNINRDFSMSDAISEISNFE